MTREEAYKVDILTSSGFDTRIVIDKIYDDFESRTCDSCSGYKSIDYCSIIDDDCSMIHEHCNGCGKWERKL